MEKDIGIKKFGDDEMQYTNRTEKRLGYITVALCFIISIALFIPFLSDAYLKIFLRGFGVIFFEAGLLLADKMLFTSYTYRIEPGEVGTDITVTERKYKRDIVVLRLDISSVKEIKEYKKGKKQRKTYKYRAIFSKEKKYILTVDDGNEVDVIVAADENFINILKKLRGI